MRVGPDGLAVHLRRMRVRPEQSRVYGQGWRLRRALRELGGRVGALALEIAGMPGSATTGNSRPLLTFKVIT